jgi:putative ABC transport system permease protein
MLQNYLKIALRSLLRQKLYSFVTIFGLAVGMAACLLIYLFVRHEWTFDRFHANEQRIFRVIQHEKAMTRAAHSFAETPVPLAPTLKATYPEIEQYCRVFANTTLVRVNGQTFNERVHIADASLLSMFTMPLRQGVATSVLANPENVVLTVSMAKKLFATEHALGKRFSIQGREGMKEYVVAGIAEDLPENSSIRFGILTSFDNAKEVLSPRALNAWGIIVSETYLLLSDKAVTQHLSDKLTKTALLYYNKVFEQNLVELRLQPMADIHLNTAIEGGLEPKGNPTSSKVLSGVAVLILFIACANFMIISLGRSVRRANEVGVRKVFGAVSGNVRLQFILEATLLSFCAILVGVVVAELALPSFNALINFHLSLRFDGLTIAVLGVLTVFVGVVAGSYPALLLSVLRPADILKGTAKFTRASRLRSSLVVMQFVISVTLIVATLVMTQQLRYMQSKNPGFTKEQVMVIHTGLRAKDGAAVYETFRNTATQRTDVVSVAGSAATVGEDIAKVGFTADNGTYHEFYAMAADEHYLPTMQIPLMQGRNFQTTTPTDRHETLIVNEAFVKHFGWDNPFTMRLPSKKFPQHRIIGVVKDFHFQSLHSAIQPMALMMSFDSVGRGIENVDGGGSFSAINTISVRIAPGNMAATVAALEQLWKQVSGSKPFDWYFLDEELNKQYRYEERLSSLAITAALLAVSIACLGLFSLAALITEQRTKEIGIRKVLGASVASIIALLSRDFLQLVAIAIIIATPLAYWAAGKWLQDFAYRVELQWWLFAAAGLSAVVIAFLTVASQAWRAARANPVNALRSE